MGPTHSTAARQASRSSAARDAGRGARSQASRICADAIAGGRARPPLRHRPLAHPGRGDVPALRLLPGLQPDRRALDDLPHAGRRARTASGRRCSSSACQGSPRRSSRTSSFGPPDVMMVFCGERPDRRPDRDGDRARADAGSPSSPSRRSRSRSPASRRTRPAAAARQRRHRARPRARRPATRSSRSTASTRRSRRARRSPPSRSSTRSRRRPPRCSSSAVRCRPSSPVRLGRRPEALRRALFDAAYAEHARRYAALTAHADSTDRPRRGESADRVLVRLTAPTPQGSHVELKEEAG